MNAMLIALSLTASTLAGEDDILDYAAAHPLHTQLSQPNHIWLKPNYDDDVLEQAAEFLAPTYPRPWTVSRLLTWYRASKEDAISAHLLRVLAASRDPRAALVLGEAIRSGSPPLRFAGCYGLRDYFPVPVTFGGTRQHMHAAERWFVANKVRLIKEALTK